MSASTPQPDQPLIPQPGEPSPDPGQALPDANSPVGEGFAPFGSPAVHEPGIPEQGADHAFPAPGGVRESTGLESLLESPAPQDAGPPHADVGSPEQAAEPGAGLAAEAAQSSDPGQPLAGATVHPQPLGAEPAASSAQPAAQLRDFRSSSLLTALELRRARLKHDQFTRCLSTRLSIYLRTELLARVTALQVLSHPKFVAELPDRAHFTLFRLEPIAGLGLLALPWPLSLALADRLLGGPGQPDTSDRGPTEVERAVLDVVTGQLLKEWARTVLELPEPRPQILGHETHRHFLPLGSADGQFLHLVIETQLGAVTEPFHLGFPFARIESVFRDAQVPAQVPQPAPDPVSAEPLQWPSSLDEIPITVTAGWDGLCLTAEQLAHLKVGDWLPLDPQRFSQVQVRLARQPKFVGRLGSTERTRAVELIGPIESKQPLVS